jgi:CO/xanthine dehydrogenase FAD-binding subunit
MDLIGVREIRAARTRDDLVFAPGELPLGGGTWLFSEEQPELTGLVDLTTLGWEPLTMTDSGLSIGATCTLAEFSRIPEHKGWTAHPLIWQCVNSLLGSFKVWNVATVGGNICMALPAGPMTSFAAAMDATAQVWSPSGIDRSIPVAALVEGVQRTALAPGEVVRSIDVPAEALESRTAFRRIALSPLGRTGTLVIGRLAPSGEATFTVTGGTERPHVLRFESLPASAALAEAVDSIEDWYDDAHGKPDWRRAMSLRFAEQIRGEL